MARTCGLIFIVLDVLKPLEHKRLIEKELEGFGIRLNKQPPNISFKKKEKGGINMTTPVRKSSLSIETLNYSLNVSLLSLQVAQSRLDLEQVRSILSEYRIHNADITLRCDATADDLIDVVEGNRVYIPAIYLLNKIDQISIEVRESTIKTVMCAILRACDELSIYCNRSWISYTRYLMQFQFLPITSGILTTYWRRCGAISASSGCEINHLHHLHVNMCCVVLSMLISCTLATPSPRASCRITQLQWFFRTADPVSRTYVITFTKAL